MINLWLKIPEKIRQEIRSVLITFASVFLLTIAIQYSQNDIVFKTDAIMAIAVAAVRAGIKAVATLVVSFITPSQPQS